MLDLKMGVQNIAIKSKRKRLKNRTVEEKIKLCKNRIKSLECSIKKHNIEIVTIKKYMKTYLKYTEE